MIVEVEKSFIDVVGSDGMAEVDTVFVFFYWGVFDDDVARESQIGEKVEDFRGIGLIIDLLLV